MILSGKRILIVEDNLSNKAIAQTILERAGAHVVTDRWGVETVERLRRCLPIDLILLDLMLPEQVSGFDVFKRIHQEPGLTQIPVVAVSAADANTAIPEAQALGFSGYISKPIDFLFFSKQIQQILSGESLWVS